MPNPNIDAEKAELKDALGLEDTPPPADPNQPPEPSATPPAPPTPKPKKEKTPQPPVESDDMELPDGLIPPPATPPATPPAKETPPEPAPVDDIKNLKLSDRQNRAFQAMREELESAKQEIEKAKATATPLDQKGDQEYAKTIEALKAQLTEAYDKLGQVSLEADPRFQTQFNVPKQNILAEIKATLKEFESDEGLAEQLLPLTRKQRIERLNEEAPEASVAILPLLMQYDQIERARSEALKNHKAMTEVLSREQQKQQAVVSQQARAQLFKQSLEQVMSDGTFILKPVEDNEAWNAGVAKVQERVKYLFTADDPAAQTQALILGAAAPIYLGMLKKEHARRVELEKQLKQRQGIRPSLDSRTPSRHEAAPKKPDEMSPDEAAERALAG